MTKKNDLLTLYFSKGLWELGKINSKSLKVEYSLLNVEYSKKNVSRKHDLLWGNCEKKSNLSSVA